LKAVDHYRKYLSLTDMSRLNRNCVMQTSFYNAGDFKLYRKLPLLWLNMPTVTCTCLPLPGLFSFREIKIILLVATAINKWLK